MLNPGRPEIEDYAVIGNGKSCALISKNGSLDWLCWPRFDSPSLFGDLLDSKKGGSWKIHPALESEIKRSYIENTNVLQTHFKCESGEIILTDFMTAMSEEEKNQQLSPENELIRQIECCKGEIEIQIHFEPCPNYGQSKAVIQDLGILGLRIEIGQQLISLHSKIQFDLSHSGIARALIKMKEGEKTSLSLTFTKEGPAVLPPVENTFISGKLSRAISWWQSWAKKAKYQGPYKDSVIRSALTLKLLGYAPSGAFIAAPTTSLPERIGGNLNWDYRYCWLRDASFTVRSLLGLGYEEEAEAFISWMLHSTRLTLPVLKVVYDVYGNEIIEENELKFLEGYQNSFPVRIGNASQDQLQLDVYGEVIDGVANFVQYGGKLDNESKKMIRHIGEYVCKNWMRKDSGIWEERNDLQNYTYSLLMCWVALDKLLKIKNACSLSKKNVEDFEKNRLLIKETIDKNAWNSEIEAYTSHLNGKMLDASVLLMPSFEYEEPNSSRMQKTYQKIKSTLEAGPGLIYRYEKSFNQEGAFLICSFWKVDFLARGGGSLEEAHEEFKKIIHYANDLGLFAEEADPKTGKSLGNFPQAFTHIGLINAALLLEEKKSP